MSALRCASSASQDGRLDGRGRRRGRDRKPAAAQYGSDAIAGVINIILKRNSEGGTVDGTYGGYFDGGGATSNVQGEAGFQPVQNSFVNVTVQVYNHGHSNRGNIDPRVVDPTLTDAADGSTYPNTNMPRAPCYPYLNMFQGDAEVHSKLVAYNAAFSLFDDVQFYSFGTYAYKDAKSYENYRLPSRVAYTDPATKVTPTPTRTASARSRKAGRTTFR